MLLLTTTQLLLESVVGSPTVLPRIKVLSVDSGWCACHAEQDMILRIVGRLRAIARERPSFGRYLVSCLALVRNEFDGSWRVEGMPAGERHMRGTCGLGADL